jgi:hypothetical protein
MGAGQGTAQADSILAVVIDDWKLLMKDAEVRGTSYRLETPSVSPCVLSNPTSALRILLGRSLKQRQDAM